MSKDKKIKLGIVKKRLVFDSRIVEKMMDISKPIYAIGIDTSDKDNLAYCLAREVNNVTEVLIAKVVKSESRFKKEVKVLSECFNAIVFKSSK